MRAGDLLRLSIRNLRNSMFRNTLTMVGISVGVSCLVALLSLGLGLQSVLNQQFRKSGLLDAVFVARPDRRAATWNKTGSRTPAVTILDEKTISRLEQLPHVAEVYPDIRVSVEVRFGESHRTIVMGGLPESLQHQNLLEQVEGRFFSSSMAPEAVLEKDFAGDLAHEAAIPEKGLIGKVITLRYYERRAGEPPKIDMIGIMMGTGGLVLTPSEKQLSIVGIIQNDHEGI